MASTIKAVLFDLDGTLVDHDTAAEVALTGTLQALPGNGHVNLDHARRLWKRLEEQAMDRYLSGELTFTEQRRLRVTGLAAELGLGTWDTEQVDAWFAAYRRRYESAWRTFPDVQPTLATLARRYPHLRLGVLTNSDGPHQRKKLQQVGLAAHLPDVIASSEVGTAKPDPAIFEYACARFRLGPAETVYVGDRLHTDALAAANAGMHGIWLNRGDTRARTEPATIHTLQDLPAHLARLSKRARPATFGQF